MYHFLYKTTNNITEQYYYGIHSTRDITDAYLGSGIRLKHNIRKYGRSNFTRKIIRLFDSGQEALRAEAILVNNNMLDDPLCLNLTMGGHGQSRVSRSTTAKRISITLKERGIGFSREAIMKSADNRRGKTLTQNHISKMRLASTGRKHTAETLKKMSEAQKTWNINNPGARKGFEQTNLQKDRAREAMHRRWHVGRDIVSRNCAFC